MSARTLLMAAASAGPPGASLSLSFMAPGTLDPRITFSRASTATYFNSAGTMQTAATNVARWDYAGGALRGLRIENAAQNVLLQSANFTVSWAANAATVATAAGVAPDGTTTMNRLAEAASTSIFFLSQSATITASTVYTLSLYARAAENRYLQLGLDNASTDGGFATFDLVAGTISGALTARGAGVIGSASIQPVGNGIYRCAVATTIGASTGARILIILANAPAPAFAPSYAGNAANGLLIWGAQLETGGFASSYVPTTTAAVTRAADLASMPTAAWFNTTNGTWQAECIPGGTAAALPAIISGNAGSPTIGINADSRLSSAIRGLVQVFSGTGPTFTFGAVNKAAFAYLSGASWAGVNGTAFGPNATAFAVTGTVVEFGSDGITPGTFALDGWLRGVRYWPRVLSSAELQQVTR